MYLCYADFQPDADYQGGEGEGGEGEGGGGCNISMRVSQPAANQ